MLGEFRTSMSDIMFLKTERYLHGGIGFVDHSSFKNASVSKSTRNMASHQLEVGQSLESDLKEADQADTLIKAGDGDFRGPIGWIHRNVHPWQDPSKPHTHTDGTELLPWFKVMTLSDPHYVRAYALGGWWLKRESLEEALKFVEEGIDKNPEAFQIHYMRGNILFDMAKKEAGDSLYDPPKKALDLFLKAQDSFQTAADLAVDQRPKNLDLESVSAAEWTFYKEGDALASARMLTLIEKYYGSEPKAVSMAKKYAAELGNDPILLRIAGEPEPAQK